MLVMFYLYNTTSSIIINLDDVRYYLSCHEKINDNSKEFVNITFKDGTSVNVDCSINDLTLCLESPNTPTDRLAERIVVKTYPTDPV